LQAAFADNNIGKKQFRILVVMRKYLVKPIDAKGGRIRKGEILSELSASQT